MAYPGQGTATAPRNPTISNCIEDFDPVIERAATYADRLQKMHDRVHGPQPAEVNTKALGDGVPHSIIGSINQRRSRLVDVLDSIERSINGLENGL